MLKRTLFRTIRNYVAALAVIATASTLVFAISFTDSNLPWTAFLTGVLAWFASARPDGLEWSLQRGGTAEGDSQVVGGHDSWPAVNGGTTVEGLYGAAAVLVLAGLLAVPAVVWRRRTTRAAAGKR